MSQSSNAFRTLMCLSRATASEFASRKSSAFVRFWFLVGTKSPYVLPVSDWKSAGQSRLTFQKVTMWRETNCANIFGYADWGFLWFNSVMMWKPGYNYKTDTARISLSQSRRPPVRVTPPQAAKAFSICDQATMGSETWHWPGQRFSSKKHAAFGSRSP